MGWVCRSLGFFQGAVTATGGHRLRGARQRAQLCHHPGCHRGGGDARRRTRLALEELGNVGRHTLTHGQEELRIGLISGKKNALAAPFWLPRGQPPRRHPSAPRTGPTLLSFRTRSHTRRELEPRGPVPPRQTDGRLAQSQRGMLRAGQSARRRGGAPRTSRPLPASMSPAAAAGAAPAAAHPRWEPRSASFSQSLQCSWSFSSAGGRGGLAGCRLTAVSPSSAILKRGLGACRTPPTKRAAIGRRLAGHAGTGSLRGCAGAGPRPVLGLRFP